MYDLNCKVCNKPMRETRRHAVKLQRKLGHWIDTVQSELEKSSQHALVMSLNRMRLNKCQSTVK